MLLGERMTDFGLFKAFEDEARVANALLLEGFRLYSKINGANDLFDIPLYSIGLGVEKLGKLCIAIDYYQKAGRFPRPDAFKKFGHKLADIHSELNKNYCTDSECLSNDPFLERMLEIIGRFITGGRFDNLNILSGASATNAVEAWKTLEEDIAREYNVGGYNVDFHKINEKIISIIEGYVKKLVELVTSRNAHPYAQQVIYIQFKYFFNPDKKAVSVRDYEQLLDDLVYGGETRS